MLKNVFSKEPAENLLAVPSTLCVLPLSGTCEISAAGLIGSGMTGFEPPVNEVWSVEGQHVERGETEHVFWSKTPDIICAALTLDLDVASPIEAIVDDAYTRLVTLMVKQGYPCPMRFWNYLPEINRGEGDNEIYKRFCTGRLNAFKALNIYPDQFPAASALGHHAKGAVIFAFAGKAPVANFNNNQQVNAYEYPRCYGLSSPSFARASAVTLASHNYLFVSGTASIIGHETVAQGDLPAQLEITISNIEYLLEYSNPSKASLQTMKVYLRHREHFNEAKSWLSNRFPDTPIIYTHADVCRENLLVEIECFCR